MPLFSQAQLRQTFTSYWSYLPLYTACCLDLFDLLVEQALSAEQLTEQMQANAQALPLLLDALVDLEVLQLTHQQQYCLSPLGEVLTEDHPKSVKYSCILWAEEHLTTWQQLPQSIITGEAAFPTHYGEDFFNYLSTRPREHRIYHKAMFEYARDDYMLLARHHDFGQHQVLLDVGGGLGALLLVLRQQWPDLSLTLLELPEVVALVSPLHQNVFNRLTGNFFDSIPKGADALMLSRILHDWEDTQALVVLQNAYEVLPVGGSLYVLENLKEQLNDGGKLLSLNMFLICNSYERSLEEYCQLIHEVGFELAAIKVLPSLPTLLHFKK